MWHSPNTDLVRGHSSRQLSLLLLAPLCRTAAAVVVVGCHVVGVGGGV